MVSTYAYPTFRHSNAVLLLAKLLLGKFPTVQKSLPLPYPSWQLYQINARITLDLVVLQYTYDVLSCTINRLLHCMHVEVNCTEKIIQ